MKKIILLVVYFSITILGHASRTIQLNDDRDALMIRGKYLDYLIDIHHKYTFADISQGVFRSKFTNCKNEDLLNNKNLNATYWMRIAVRVDSTTRKKWIVELYDFRIDELEAYIPDGTGKYRMFKAGANKPFSHKVYMHKNFIFDINTNRNNIQYIYFKIKADRPVSLVGTVRSYQKLLNHATSEYFLLALFYGVVIVMTLYNFFLFIATKDSAYIYYVLYVSSIGIYSLTQDGIGFQYLWYDHPVLNNHLAPLFTYAMIVWALMYAKSFLHQETQFAKIMEQGITLIIVLRTFVFILSFIYPNIVYFIWIDLIPLMYIYLYGIVCWVLGYKMARFYVIAFTLFFVGFVSSVLKYFNILSDNIYVVYSFNIGVLSEMILLSMALADRIKMLTMEKEKAQKEIIVKFKENETLKDDLNKALEAKVIERTKELENKNKELDTFIYRSSHDIKGPLKSIIGLAEVGLEDIKDHASRNYFEHILKSSKRLDNVVDHLLTIMDVKETELNIQKINIGRTIFEILENMKQYSFHPNLKIDTSIQGECVFYSDPRLLYLVIQSLVQNAYFHIDNNKNNSYLNISVYTEENATTFVFFDNGIGIEDKIKEKMFDVFYSVPTTGLSPEIGLYMTKIYVEKLEGQLHIDSENGKGTNFKVQLKNLQYIHSVVS